jgi:hypothetical protein
MSSRRPRPDDNLKAKDDGKDGPHKPTAESRRRVEAMAAYGLSEQQMALILGTTRKGLRYHYPDELMFGRDKANAKVAEAVYARAIDKNHPQGAQSAQFWLKTRAGWKETVAVENTIKSQEGPDLSGFSTEQLLDIATGKDGGRRVH